MTLKTPIFLHSMLSGKLTFAMIGFLFTPLEGLLLLTLVSERRDPLLTLDIAITSVGSEIVYGMVTDDVWKARLSDKWNRDIVVEETSKSKFPQLEPQPDKSQEEHKVSFFVHKEHVVEILKVLPGRLEKRGVDVKLVYSNGSAFDVLPRGAGKQGALTYLLEKWEIEGKQPLNTLVCGDSGNGADLFNISHVYGVMVCNSHEELLQWHEENAKENPKIIHASERCGAGIIEVLQKFNMGPSVSPRDVWDSENLPAESLNPAHEVVQFYLFDEKWRCGEVEKSDKYLQNFKSLSVSVLGVHHYSCSYSPKEGSYFAESRSMCLLFVVSLEPTKMK